MVSQWHQLVLITISIINLTNSIVITLSNLATLIISKVGTLSSNFLTCRLFTQFTPPTKLLATLLSILCTYLLSHPHSGILDTTLPGTSSLLIAILLTNHLSIN